MSTGKEQVRKKTSKRKKSSRKYQKSVTETKGPMLISLIADNFKKAPDFLDLTIVKLRNGTEFYLKRLEGISQSLKKHQDSQPKITRSSGRVA